MKDNEIIAEFMKVDFSLPYMWRPGSTMEMRVEFLDYHKTWDWIIPVVEKIENLDLSVLYDENNFMNVEVSIDTGHCNIYVQLNYDPAHRITGISNYDIPKIDLVYSQVVNFIKWYNERRDK